MNKNRRKRRNKYDPYIKFPKKKTAEANATLLTKVWPYSNYPKYRDLIKAYNIRKKHAEKWLDNFRKQYELDFDRTDYALWRRNLLIKALAKNSSEKEALALLEAFDDSVEARELALEEEIKLTNRTNRAVKREEFVDEIEQEFKDLEAEHLEEVTLERVKRRVGKYEKEAERLKTVLYDGVHPQPTATVPHMYRWSSVVLLYLRMLNAPFGQLFLFYKNNSPARFNSYKLMISFSKQKIHITLSDYDNATLITLSPGLFVKFLDKKKSFKKSRGLRVIMAKYMRKVILSLGIRKFEVTFKNIPLSGYEIMSALTTPIGYAFMNPATGEIVNETKEKKPRNRCVPSTLVFMATKSFTNMKIAKRGRIKRKLKRRLVRSNSLID